MTSRPDQREFRFPSGHSTARQASPHDDVDADKRRVESRLSRRRMLGSGVAAATGLAGAMSVGMRRQSARAAEKLAPAIAGQLDTTVRKIERIQLNVPFRDLPRLHMRRTRAINWTYIEVCRITLGCGAVGIGEVVQYFLEPRGDNRRVLGRDAAELMWDDTLGSGLQGALLDAVAKVNDVPIHRLLGPKYRDRALLSWWAVDMPGEDWVKECQAAVRQGYTSLKTKARPWWDLDEQCRVLGMSLPAYFKVGVDFNGMLRDSSTAVPYCRQIEKYAFVANYETPIPQDDVQGNKAIRRQTRVPIAMHYGVPPIMTAIREDVCDTLIIGGGAARVMRQGAIAAAARKPFWLQNVGTGITAALSLHFAAVLSHARWPAVNCHQLYVHPLIRPKITVNNGLAEIPESPGLGFELDDEALERFRTEEFKRAPPPPKQLIAIRWPSGDTSYYANPQECYNEFGGGRLPVFPKGISLENISDNGSREWAELHRKAQNGGVHSAGRPM